MEFLSVFICCLISLKLTQHIGKPRQQGPGIISFTNSYQLAIIFCVIFFSEGSSSVPRVNSTTYGGLFKMISLGSGSTGEVVIFVLSASSYALKFGDDSKEGNTFWKKL